MEKEYNRIREAFKWALRKRRQRASKKSNDNRAKVGAPPSAQVDTVSAIPETGENQNVSLLLNFYNKSDLSTQVLNAASTASTPAPATPRNVRAPPVNSTDRASTAATGTLHRNLNPSSGVAIRAATLAATAGNNRPSTNTEARTLATTPAPNVAISFNELLNLSVLRRQNPPNAHSAPPLIPHQSSGLVADPPDTVEPPVSPRENSSLAVLVTEYSTATKDVQQHKDSLTAGPAKSPLDCLINNISEDQARLSNDSDSDDSTGRSVSYLQRATKTLSPSIASGSQRQRVVSPPQVGTRLRGKTRAPQDPSDKSCAPNFYGQAKEKKQKTTPAVPEKKKRERKNLKPPKRGLKQ